VAEHLGSSGKDLILATALAHEVPTRLQYGMDNRWQRYVTEGPDKGKLTNPDVAGVGVNTFGGTIGVGRLLKLNRDKMGHAIGIAGYNQPVPTYGKWTRTRKGGMMKWGSAGWICHTAVIAALLAEMGYTADQTVLEGDQGFWRYYGSATWDPDKVTEKLGEQWRMIEIMWYKAYPSGGIIHSALEVFTRIIEENNLFPGDIDKVTVWADPLTAMARFQDREIETEIDAQFNTAYEFAARAYRIPLEDWQNLNNIRNPKIKEFMQRVTNHAHPEFGKIMLETPQARIAKVEVEAKGKIFVDEGVFVRGQSYRGRIYPEKARQTDDWLIDKFRRNAARVLPSYKMDKAPQAILELEKMENVSDLMKLVTI
jgi:2-methylcitrate dehydratase PrpD